MEIKLYQFINYRTYLKAALAERGRKKLLAEFLPSQTTFISNVMAGIAHLSLEHAMRVCEFLEFDEGSSHYFMLLVQYEKAGSEALGNYYFKQILAIQAEQMRS